MTDTQPSVDRTLDCLGLSCPMPVIRTKKAMEDMRPGQVLEVLATDPGSVADVKSWTVRVGHQFIGTTAGDSVFRHYIRKSDPREVSIEIVHPDRVTNADLLALLPKDIAILDVREPMEYAFGHIPGARLAPLGMLEELIPDLEHLRAADVYVICRSGSRSDAACQILRRRGFARVHNVVPGMHAWSGPLDAEGGRG